MVILHSEIEWWISAAMELDELHVSPAAGGDTEPRGAAANPWPRAEPEQNGRTVALGSFDYFKLFRISMKFVLTLTAVNPKFYLQSTKHGLS